MRTTVMCSGYAKPSVPGKSPYGMGVLMKFCVRASVSFCFRAVSPGRDSIVRLSEKEGIRCRTGFQDTV